MNWQIRYALEMFSEQTMLTAEHLQDELIRLVPHNQPEVLAVITAAHSVDAMLAAKYLEQYRSIDFLCGYRKTCIWHGEAIQHLEVLNVGWGSAGTLMSAALEGNANRATHKTYRFADRLLRQLGRVREVKREYDRVHQVTLDNGVSVRIVMIAEYEPTADAVRSMWDDFGPFDVAWNINPNGSPTPEAIEAGNELGCEVIKWEELRERLRKA